MKDDLRSTRLRYYERMKEYIPRNLAARVADKFEMSRSWAYDVITGRIKAPSAYLFAVEQIEANKLKLDKINELTRQKLERVNQG
jgi:hypothetical protein